jgi:hypothetical protein
MYAEIFRSWDQKLTDAQALWDGSVNEVQGVALQQVIRAANDAAASEEADSTLAEWLDVVGSNALRLTTARASLNVPRVRASQQVQHAHQVSADPWEHLDGTRANRRFALAA